MIAIETRQLAGGVVLHAFPEGKRAVPLPCVVFYHGFTSSSLVYSYFAVALAQAGFRVVMPDAPEHGARFGGDSQDEYTDSGRFCTKTCRNLRRYVRRFRRKTGYLTGGWRWAAHPWAV